VEQHNHYLASPNKAHKLRSQRQVIEADKKLIGQIREAGMKPTQVYEFMKEFYGGEENIPFSKKDYDNEIGRECRQYLEANDAQTLSEYLRNKQDPAFFYAFQVDKDYLCLYLWQPSYSYCQAQHTIPIFWTQLDY
jgi:hypothetical protein